MKQVKSFFGISAALSLHAQTLLVTPVRCSVCLSHSWPSEIWCWHSFFKSASPDKAQNWCHFWDWTIQVSSTSGLANHLFPHQVVKKWCIYNIIYICETKVDNFDMTQHKACSFSTPIIRLELQEASTTAHRIATELDTLTWQIENAAHGWKAIPWIDLRYLPSGYLT